ncbi:uncharacterized protein [Panulirus ornatus]|uniref:uncharacterized protein isoform X2 n=1 Tax=Panulirus ornatus TaxID=150431 RepID=UPI003A89D7EA
MQRHYLHPRCGICRITFPSRMVYEHHIASINHLRVRTATIDNQGGNRRSDDRNKEEDGDDLDLANFMTLDSVGEDDDDVGSEHEEITGGLDAVEAAEKEAATGEEEEDDDDDDDDDDDLDASIQKEKDGLGSSRRGKGGSKKGTSRGGRHRGPDDEDDDDAPLETDWEKEQPEDEEEEGHKPLGTEYVRRIEAYFCSLCSKIIRADSSLGSRAVQRHCRSFNHLSHYWDHHPAPHQDDDDASGEDGEGEVDIEDTDQDKLWEEVDKGLTALQGEIMTEIEGEDVAEEKNNEEKVNGAEEENKEIEEEDKGGSSESKEENKNGDKDDSPQKEDLSHDDTLEKEDLDEVGDDFTG